MSPSDAKLIEECGLDAFLFLRYLKTLLRVFIPLALLILPILIPINLYSGRGVHNGVSGLDQMAWTNIDPSHTNRYWAHLCLSVLVVLWVCRVFWHELNSYTRLRQRRLMSQAPSTTVLVTDIPRELISVERLERIYSIYPGGVRKVWLQRDYSELYDRVDERKTWVLKLEAAETRLIEKALLSHKASPQARAANPDQPLWKSYLTQADRERYTIPPLGKSWLPSLPFLGRQVDLIDYGRERVASLNQSIHEAQDHLEDFPLSNAAVIQFERPAGAHMACRSTHHPTPHLMTSRLVDEGATHVVWKNMSMGWWNQYLRGLVIGGLMATFCALFVVPVAFTGLLSQLNYLASVWPRLAWLKDLPKWSQGVLQGVLPPCILAATTFLLPVILERLILEQGVHTFTSAELLLQDYYFGFLFLQIFLVVSISSSVAAVLNGMGQDFESLAALIAQNLPKAGNYFFSYMLLQGLSVSAGTLLQLGRLISFFISPFCDKTARQKWERQSKSKVKWGTFFPVYTNLAVIGLVYSVVSPLILVFNITTFALFLIVQQYNILNVLRFDTDTGGLIYPKAIKQLFTGLYVMEMYLTGLFFLVRNSQDQPACIGQAAIMLIVLVFTAIYHKILAQAYEPLLHHLPVMLGESTDKEVVQSPSNGNTGHRVLDVINRYELLDTFLGRQAPIADNFNGESNDTRPESGEMTDQVTIAKQPVIWLPHDKLGVCDDEIMRTQRLPGSIRISNENAYLDERVKVEVHGPPPLDEQPEIDSF